MYARLSVTTEESVSIGRQLEAGRKYADARGWEVVLEAVDDGVSATKNKPEDRVGWRQVLDHPDPFDAVIVWKVDRLARRVLDFLHADAALQERGAGLVAVEDPIDMTTPQGRAFATMLAVFGEMEAAAISARVTAARRAIVQAGRRAGGRPPFGWMNVPNPEGPGYVLGKDPDRIGIVEELAVRAMAGESLYSLARWLEAEGIAPRARGQRKDPERWHDSSVETILRAPSLAGMTPYRGDVLRDTDGLPIVQEDVAILSTGERRQLLAALDARKMPGSRPNSPTVGLLSGIAKCGTCGWPMHRATAAKRFPYYRCARRDCDRKAGISRPSLEAYVVEQFLRVAGRLEVVRREVDEAPGAEQLADVEAAIAETVAAMADDDADVAALSERLVALKAARTRARADAEASPDVRLVPTGRTFRDAWDATDDVGVRRDLLATAIDGVYVDPSQVRGGPKIDPTRIRIDWRR